MLKIDDSKNRGLQSMDFKIEALKSMILKNRGLKIDGF